MMTLIISIIFDMMIIRSMSLNRCIKKRKWRWLNKNKSSKEEYRKRKKDKKSSKINNKEESK